MSDQPPEQESGDLAVPSQPSTPASTGGYGGFTKGGTTGARGFGPPPPSGDMPEGRLPAVAAPTGMEHAARPVVPESALASRRSRLATGLIDTFVVGIIPLLVFVLLFRFAYRGSCDAFDRFDGGTTYINCSGVWRIVTVVVPILLLLGIGWYLEIRRQLTGRLTVGARQSFVQVVDAATLDNPGTRQAWIRFVVRMFASLPLLGAGYWWMFRDTQRRTLHDIVARTVVVEADPVERIPGADDTFRSVS